MCCRSTSSGDVCSGDADLNRVHVQSVYCHYYYYIIVVIVVEYILIVLCRHARVSVGRVQMKIYNNNNNDNIINNNNNNNNNNKCCN